MSVFTCTYTYKSGKEEGRKEEREGRKEKGREERRKEGRRKDLLSACCVPGVLRT
jgi:hypothetical protein